MPIYLKSIGFSVLFIGILEGVAEATAGLSKAYFGRLSDCTNRRVPFVQLGYAFSSISKPLMAVFVAPLWIFFARTLDRLGKGIRTGARDAMLSDESTPETKGRVFGFHRSMDTLGAVIGPLFALCYLYFKPEDYKTLFLIAFIPGLMAILTTSFLKEKSISNQHVKNSKSFFSFLDYWKESPQAYKKLLLGLLLFALINSSDAFLLLKSKESGLDDVHVISVYIFYNLIYALLAFPVGILADRIGLKNIFLLGLLAFIIVYFGMAGNTNIYIIALLFFLYGFYAAATEGISKAWISNLIDKKDTATAIGTYSGLQSICALISSSLTGFIWFQFGSAVALGWSGLLGIFVLLYLFLHVKPVTRLN